MICEIVESGRVLPEGSVGNVVLTDPGNRAMPLIRYQVLDRGRLLKEACSCGIKMRLMRPVPSRVSDYLTLPGGDIISPYLLTIAIEKAPGLLMYQIIQEVEGQITVKLIQEKQSVESVKQIKREPENVLAGKLDVLVEICDQLPVEANGKFKVIKSQILNQARGEVV